jgi:hypothetical protein
VPSQGPDGGTAPSAAAAILSIEEVPLLPVVVDSPRWGKTQYLAEAKEKYDGGALPKHRRQPT